MHREQFGAWGAQLESTPFWQAVAALGCTDALVPGCALLADAAAGRPFGESLLPRVSTRRHLRWTWSFSGTSWARELASGPAPEAWVELWASFIEAAHGHLPRMALAAHFDNQTELVKWFLQGVASSVYVEQPWTVPGLAWQNPPRIASVGPQAESDEVDLLVVPAALDQAAALLRRSPVVFNANCIVVAQPHALDWRLGYAQARALEELCAANAVLVAPLAHPASAQDYAADVAANLQNGMTLDEAAQRSPRLWTGEPAVLMAAPALIEAAWPSFSSDRFRSGSIPLSFGDAIAFDTPAPPAPRFLQAKLFEQSTPVETLRPDAELRVDVCIGPPADDAIIATEAFPDQECAGQLLTVLFSEPRLAPQPQLRTLFLPPSGASAAVSFALRLTPQTTAIEARITVLYRNRVLQTALLRASVGEWPHLEVEMSVRPGLRNLAAQRPADYALLLNHTGDGEARATAGAGYAFATFSMEGLQAWIDEIEAQVNGTPWNDDSFAQLESEGTERLLRFLARRGAALYKEFLRYEPDPQRLKNSAFVQVVSREHGARLPIEFFYDRKPPKSDAKLCPNARKALENGACAGCSEDQTQVVCPLGFWCFRKVIEHHRFRDDAKQETQGRAYALRDVQPGERPEALPALTSALLAASSKVDAVVAGSVDAVRQALVDKMGANVGEARSWQQWCEQVAARSPALLLLLPHTAKDDDNVPQMEIRGDMLASLDIEQKYVLGPDGKPHPVVLLLGCNTDNSGLPFESFVPFFEDNQAAIVVTSISKVLGRHAAPLARTFIDKLSALPHDGQSSFGEAMLAVRRAAMLDGPPLALVLKSYGDADWRV